MGDVSVGDKYDFRSFPDDLSPITRVLAPSYPESPLAYVCDDDRATNERTAQVASAAVSPSLSFLLCLLFFSFSFLQRAHVVRNALVVVVVVVHTTTARSGPGVIN